jgi:hypothetical protein
MQRNKPADDGRICQEEDPDPVPSLAILEDDLLLVANPVEVPSVDSGGVVDPKDIDVLDLEASTFQLIDNPAQRA